MNEPAYAAVDVLERMYSLKLHMEVENNLQRFFSLVLYAVSSTFALSMTMSIQRKWFAVSITHYRQKYQAFSGYAIYLFADMHQIYFLSKI